MKRNRRYIIVLSACLVIFVVATVFAPHQPDWTRTYDTRSDEPFGSVAIRHFLSDVFPQSDVIDITASILETTDALVRNPDPRIYLFLNNGFNYRGQGVDLRLDEFETEALLDFVSRGNIAFLGTESIEGPLNDSLGLAWSSSAPLVAITPDDDTRLVSLNAPGIPDSAAVSVSVSLAAATIVVDDSLGAEVLGHLTTGGSGQTKLVNFVALPWGEGRIFIHSNPGLFSNYGLAEAGTAPYVFAALSHMPDSDVLVDDYYKAVRGKGARTPLRYVLRTPDLRLAYIVIVVGVMLFVVSGARRRQRAIPIVAPPANATLSFVNTVGRLHLAQGDHRSTADRKLRHWLEFLRDELGLQTADLADIDAQRVAARAGVEKTRVDRILTLAINTGKKRWITSADLAALAGEIDRFYTEYNQ